MRKFGTLGCLLLFMFSEGSQGGFVTLDVPESISTVPTGISNGVIVGQYEVASNSYGLLGSGGFIFQNGHYTLLNFPGALNTNVGSISGDKMVGGVEDSSGRSSGFIYNGKTYTMFSFPGATGTNPTGISGNTIVGTYIGSSVGPHGFIYNGKMFSALNYPGAISTTVTGISGQTIVGQYFTPGRLGGLPVSIAHNFLYKNGTYTSINIPGLPSATILGINGKYLVGYYSTSSTTNSGFLYDGKTITTLNAPGARFPGGTYSLTFASAVDANGNVVGDFNGAKGTEGFLYTSGSTPRISAAPEPSSLMLLTLGALAVAGCWRIRQATVCA